MTVLSVTDAATGLAHVVTARHHAVKRALRTYWQARTASLASEISANIAEQALLSLLAPIERVTAWDTVTPMFRLEERYMPNAARVAAAARKVLEYQ